MHQSYCDGILRYTESTLPWNLWCVCSCLDYVDELLTILNDNPTMTVGENIAEDAENLEVNLFWTRGYFNELPVGTQLGGGATPSLKDDVNFSELHKTACCWRCLTISSTVASERNGRICLMSSVLWIISLTYTLSFKKLVFFVECRGWRWLQNPRLYSNHNWKGGWRIHKNVAGMWLPFDRICWQVRVRYSIYNHLPVNHNGPKLG